jgi:hypothetical protein
MRKKDVTISLSSLAFDYFYWFSRFEFALKENGYLNSHVPGAKAEPGWREFVDRWASTYVVSTEAGILLAEPPERQIVVANDQLDWRPVGLTDCTSELAKVIRLIATVRNNLFHGGKHGGAGWDSPKRTELLLVASKSVLDQLAQLASLEADYTQYY